MMAQSKLKSIPLVESVTNLGHSYSLALESRPVLVKAVTSGFLAALGNVIGQKLEGRRHPRSNVSKKDEQKQKSFNWRVMGSYAIFGFCVNGPLSNYYLNWLEKYGPDNRLAKLVIDRLIYGPSFLYVTLYLLSILQGQGLEKTRRHVRTVYWSALKANLKIWIIFQYVNLNFVPLQYRTLVSSLISLFWNIYLSLASSSSKQDDTTKQTKKIKNKE